MATEKTPKRVAVVGCGVSGLAAIKSCLEEGLQPTCFEMNADIGGLWYSPETAKPSRGPYLYDSLITNTSKAIMCFSDFPFPKDYPPYLPHKLYYQYLQSYVNHFELRQYVQFSTKVMRVDKADNYSTTGRWVVSTCPIVDGSTKTEQTTREEFDCVVICQGVFHLPYTPRVPGLEEFGGKVDHVINYKHPEPFRDRNVIVVGSASSAGDIACDIAPIAKQVYLSVHQGAYVLSRVVNGRTPVDFSLTRGLSNLIPSGLMMKFAAGLASKILDPVVSGIKPKPSVPLSQVSFLINDFLPHRVFTGQVKVVDCIERLTKSDVILEDSKILQNIDDIIFATGYKHDIDIIPRDIISPDPESEKLELYKMAFPLSLPHNTLALIGCYRNFGPAAPGYEIQTRLVARVMAGRHKLPDRDTMKRAVDKANKEIVKLRGSYKYVYPYLDMADDLAEEVGVRPIWWKLVLRGDFKMARAVLFGPAFPFHYRLMGPYTWSGARDATLNAYNETIFSMQHRRSWETEEKKGEKSGGLLGRFVCMSAIGLLLCFVWQVIQAGVVD